MATWKVPARSGNGGGERPELPPEDSHAAVCVAVIDLGHQLRRKYQSSEEEWQPMLYLCWELVDLPGRPLVGRDFKVSLHEKAGLRHFVEAWVGGIKDGADFDLFSLAGRPCFLDCRHQQKGDNTYLRIEGASRPPRHKGKELEVEAPEHEPFTAAIDDPRRPLPYPLPYLYGRPIPEWLADSRERRQATGGPARADGGAGREEEIGTGAGGPSGIPF